MPTPSAAEQFRTQLQGTWEGCVQLYDYGEEGNEVSASERETQPDFVPSYAFVTLTFSAEQYEFTEVYYPEGIQCTGNPVDSNSASGTISVGDSTQTPSGATAFDVDYDRGTANAFFDIFNITDGVLYSGDLDEVDTGSSQATRPTEINFDRPLNRAP